MVRARDELGEGADDERILAHARRAGRVVVTCDRRSTVSEGAVTAEHAGVIYADQTDLQARPEDAASGVDRIVSTLTTEAMEGGEFYLRAWM